MAFRVAFSQAPSCYPSRMQPSFRNWATMDQEYAPRDWTAGEVFLNAEGGPTGNSWADREDTDPFVLGGRRSFAMGGDGPVRQVAVYDRERSRYLFPGGRTGIRGRGKLGRFGPNHAADPIVTRFHKGRLQVVLIRRNDGSDELAFPGGMVDPGATHTTTLKSEFTQEAVKPGGAVDTLFSECSRGIVYRGVVDDWRTTDEAWIETHALNFQ